MKDQTLKSSTYDCFVFVLREHYWRSGKDLTVPFRFYHLSGVYSKIDSLRYNTIDSLKSNELRTVDLLKQTLKSNIVIKVKRGKSGK